MQRAVVAAVFLSLSLGVGFAQTPEQSPGFLVHLLDYLAKDYGGAVHDGKVISASEYSEQVEFSKSALDAQATMPALNTEPKIGDDLKRLSALIAAKASAIEVAELARSIQTEVIEAARLEVAPSAWPSLAKGEELFAQNCVSCHGVYGRGDGEAGVKLDPKPANFLDAERMGEMSPYQAYNAIRFGIPGTGMTPFPTLSDRDVWALSFYIVSLRHADVLLQGEANATLPDFPKIPGDLLKTAASATDNRISALLEGENDEKQKALAILRTHSGDDGAAGALGLARRSLKEAVTSYSAGEFEAAKANALKAYLEGVEPIEPRLKATDPDAVIELEGRMSAVRGAIESRKPLADIRAVVTLADVELSRAGTLLEKKGMSASLTFITASAIMMREGFEAVLLILALLGVIRAAGARRAALWVHGGWMTAVACGGVAWIFSGWLLRMSGAGREMMEASITLFAVAVLLYVGFWLHRQTEIGRWRAFLDGKVKKALEGKNLIGLATISFLAVFREAFETVLFLRAVWLDSGESAKTAMAAGVFSSLVLILVLAWVLLQFSARIPIRKLFTASAGVMAVLATILTGKGLHSLQEAGHLSISTLPGNFRWDLFGIYPTWETVLSQVLVVGLMAVLWTYGARPSERVALRAES